MYQYGSRAGWTPLQQQSQQSKLPPGWEAKWDPGSSRWFYVNHATKTTQWEAPVPNAAQYRAPTAPQTNTTSFIDNTAQNSRTLMSEYNGVAEDYILSLLRIYQNNMAGVRRTLDEKGYSKKLVQQQQRQGVVPKQQFIASLKSQYPTVSEDILKEVLISTNNSYAGARTSLQAMGYKQRPRSPTKQGTGSQQSRPSTAAQTSQPKAEPKTSFQPAKLSEQMKKSRYEELRKKFPRLDKALIELSLEGTNYNVKMASAVLQASIDSVSSKAKTSAASRATTTASTTRYTSSSPTKPDASYSSSASFAPVIFGAEEDDKKETSSTTTGVSTSSYITKTTSPTHATFPKYTYTQAQKRDYVPVKRPQFVRKPVVQVGGYVSSNRLPPVGPNPALANGPNYSLLCTTRLQPAGPNSANRYGPQMSNRCGPQASNAMGRAHIDVGPAARLLSTAV